MKVTWKIFVAVLCFIGGELNLHAQSSLYCYTIGKLGSTSSIPALAIALDASSNTFILGTFTNATTVNGTALNNASGWPNIFTAKTTLLRWTKAPTTDYTISHAKMHCDNKGNVYVAGTFGGTTITFGTVTLTNHSTDYSGDIFLAKYDNLGSLKWLTGLGGTSDDPLGDLITDTNGNCFVTGNFQSPIFAAGNSNLVLQGTGGDCFTAKYDASGNLLWLAQGSNARGTCLAFDTATNCYVGGYVTGPASFNGINPSNSTTSNFLAKYFNAGGLAWVRGDLMLGKFICVDAVQNIYTAGTFSNSVQCGSLMLSNTAASTIFVAKYDGNGNALWARQLPGWGNDDVTGLIMDSLTNFWISGTFAGADTSSNSIAVVARLDASGALTAMSQINSPKSSASGVTAAKYSNKPMVYVCGSYATNFTLPGPVSNITRSVTNSGNTDVFYAWVQAPPPISTTVASTNLVCSWPNTDTNLLLESSSDLSNWSGVTNSISTVNGQNVVTNSINSSAGFFRLRLK